jgi:hypothetical protein
MHSWGDFTRLEPGLAGQGGGILYHFGVGLAFLATVRRDGGPRLHPMCPLLTSEALCAFMVPSPKQRDLDRDGRFALHSFPMEDNEDAFYVSGRATAITDPERRATFAVQFVNERNAIGVPEPAADHRLFELLIERAMLTRTTGHGDHEPIHTIWRSDQTEPSVP